VATLADRWELVEVGAAFDGGSASAGSRRAESQADRSAPRGDPAAGENSTTVVAPVRKRDGRRFILKVVPDPRRMETERLALEHWGGSGAVGVEAVAPELGAVLLERVEPGTCLWEAGLDDDEECAVFCDVVSRLRRGGSPRLPRLPLLSSWLDALRPAVALPGLPGGADALRRRALDLGERLLAEGETTVLHGDLHHGNLLAAGPDSWVAIDPKGILGPPEAEPAAFLRNPRERLLKEDEPVPRLRRRVAMIAERLGYHEPRVAAWAFVLAVVAAAWAMEDEAPGEAEAWLACAHPLQHVSAAVHP
jgi:streptomycin 6-kinase